MATNLALDDQLIEEARLLGGHRTKREVVTQALLDYVQKKKQIQAQIESWSQALMAGECPAPIKNELYKILFKRKMKSCKL